MDIKKLNKEKMQELLGQYEEITGIKIGDLPLEQHEKTKPITIHEPSGLQPQKQLWYESIEDNELDVDTPWLRMCVDGAL